MRLAGVLLGVVGVAAPRIAAADPEPGAGVVLARVPGARLAEPLAGRVYAIGTRFSSNDLACGIGDAPQRDFGIATHAGATTLVCGGDPDQPRIEVPIIVVPVIVSGELRPVRATVSTVVHVAVASVGKLGDALVVTGEDDLMIEGAQRTTAGVDVTVRAATAGSYGLVVSAGDIALGRLDLEAIAPPVETPPSPPAPLAWFALDLGGHVGFFAPGNLDSTSTLGRPTLAGDAVDWGPLVGGRVGLYPTRRVGLEVEAALATTGYVQQSGVSAVAITRAQLAVRAVEDGTFGLRLLAGADLLAELVERGSSHRVATGGVHYGAAFTIEAHRDTWLRFEVLDVVLPARDAGFAHCFELQIGVVTRLGRRDHVW